MEVDAIHLCGTLGVGVSGCRHLGLGGNHELAFGQFGSRVFVISAY